MRIAREFPASKELAALFKFRQPIWIPKQRRLVAEHQPSQIQVAQRY